MISLFPYDNIETSVDNLLIKTLHEDIRQGPKVDQFEKELGVWIGNPNIVTTCSGTAALQLALRCANVGIVNSGFQSDEVVVTPMTCAATVMPIIASGARPVWADIDPATGLLNPSSVESRITPRTKAIICVHWGGTPCAMDNLRNIGRFYRIPIIEDAAHAFGALDSDNRKIGNQTSDFTMFSFQALKHLTCGDGGALSIKSFDLYKLAKLARWYGIDREGAHKDSRHEENIETWGVKWHMNDLNATIGIEQLKYANSIVEGHRRNAILYWNNIDRDRFIPAFPEKTLYSGSFWIYTILMRNRSDRIRFTKYMADTGIRISQIHTRNDHHDIFKSFKNGSLPGVDEFSERMVCLPIHWKLKDLELAKIIQSCQGYADLYGN